MAVDKQESSGADAFRGRRWVFGTNVAVMLAAATAILVVVNWLGQRAHVSGDWTASGANSLSQRTRKLVEGLDQRLRLTSFYMVTDITKQEQKLLDPVQDLFRLYQRANPARIEIGNINLLKEREKVGEVLSRLKERYKEESAKHRKIIEESETLAPQLAQTFEDDRNAFGSLLEAHESLAQDQGFRVLYTQLFSRQARSLRKLKNTVETFQEADIPRYDLAVDEIKAKYETAKQFMPQVVDWLREKAVKLSGIDKNGREVFEKIAGKYDMLIKKVQEVLDAAEDLPKLELGELAEKLKQRTILVETEKRAKVIPFDDVWRRRQQQPFSLEPEEPAAPEKTYTFHGEAAVSSAILQLTQEEKTAVVFVRFGGNSPIKGGFQPPMGFSAPEYGVVNRRLEEANFLVQDWDVATSSSLPTTDEKIKRRIFVLLRPEEVRPNPRMPQPTPPRRFSPDDAKTVEEKIGENGRVVILAGFMQPRRQAMFRPRPEQYEWADYLSKWGVRCEARKLILEGMSRAPGEWVRPNPYSAELEQMDHPIAKGIRGLRLSMPWAAPLEKMDPLPQGVTVTPLTQTVSSEDIWAVGDLPGLNKELRDGFYTKHPQDPSSPLVVAMACTNDKGGKAVVISSFEFAKDEWAKPQWLLQGGRLRMREPFPGNAELLLNSIFWLNDNENRIGVGPRSGDVRLIGDISKGALAGWRWTAWAGWPLVAMVLGGVVWFIRRR